MIGVTCLENVNGALQAFWMYAQVILQLIALHVVFMLQLGVHEIIMAASEEIALITGKLILLNLTKMFYHLFRIIILLLLLLVKYKCLKKLQNYQFLLYGFIHFQPQNVIHQKVAGIMIQVWPTYHLVVSTNYNLMIFCSLIQKVHMILQII